MGSIRSLKGRYMTYPEALMRTGNRMELLHAALADCVPTTRPDMHAVLDPDREDAIILLV